MTFLVAENGSDASAVLSSRIAQKKSNNFSEWILQLVPKRAGYISLAYLFFFFSYPNACLELGVVLCSDWVLETNL